MERDGGFSQKVIEKKDRQGKSFLKGSRRFLAAFGLSTLLLTGGYLHQRDSLTPPSPRDFVVKSFSTLDQWIDKLGRDVNTQNLIDWIDDVPSSSGYKYDVRDNLGVGMDSVKIIENPQGGYLSVYHHTVNGVQQTRLATSGELLNWTFRTVIEPSSSQATIEEIPGNGFLVAMEKSSDGNVCGGKGSCNMIKYYPNLAALYAGAASRVVTIPRVLSNCSEGTPNIYSASLNPDIDHSEINLGFHFHKNCDVDRQARGKLVNFRSWSAGADYELNKKFERLGNILGNVGDRDEFNFAGNNYIIIEGQNTNGDFQSWKPYLYKPDTGDLAMLDIKTHKGQRSFGNPTFTNLKLPNGKPGFVTTQFLFSESPNSPEGGSLIYYKEYPPYFMPDLTQGDLLAAGLVSLIFTPKLFALLPYKKRSKKDLLG